jgi:TubC N-terminal docking domain
MMADLVMVECERRGITLAVNGDRITCRGPEDAITAPLLDAIRQHKADLIGRLGAPAIAPGTGISPPWDRISPPLVHPKSGEWTNTCQDTSDSLIIPNGNRTASKTTISPPSPQKNRERHAHYGGTLPQEGADIARESLAYNVTPPLYSGGLGGLVVGHYRVVG